MDVDLVEGGGVKKRIVTEGKGGSPPDRSVVIVHYTGTLPNGSEFDSSRKKERPFRFVLGAVQVIKAWDIGIASMRIGERAILTCGPGFAYGEAGFPPVIPPNATLLFDVELIGIENASAGSMGCSLV